MALFTHIADRATDPSTPPVFGFKKIRTTPTTHSETPHKLSQKNDRHNDIATFISIFLKVFSLRNAAPLSLHAPFVFLCHSHCNAPIHISPPRRPFRA
jgi:hypothetical protein